MKYWRTPLDLGRIQGVQGKVLIIAERCKGCEFCITYCPRGVIRMSKSYNPKGYHYPEVADADKCVNCHFCEVLCPEFAIYSIEIPAAPVAAGQEAVEP
jgi:2-oxoglutarate ferredoxin oxidoreductase subunit delta